MMNMTMNRALDYSRYINNIRLEAAMEPIDIISVCKEAAAIVLSFANEGVNIRISYKKGTKDKLFVSSDRGWLKDNLLCLLSNSCKYTRDSNVDLTIKTDVHFVHFEVGDSGEKLSDEQLELFFYPQSNPNVLLI